MSSYCFIIFPLFADSSKTQGLGIYCRCLVQSFLLPIVGRVAFTVRFHEGLGSVTLEQLKKDQKYLSFSLACIYFILTFVCAFIS